MEMVSRCMDSPRARLRQPVKAFRREAMTEQNLPPTGRIFNRHLHGRRHGTRKAEALRASAARAQSHRPPEFVKLAPFLLISTLSDAHCGRVTTEVGAFSHYRSALTNTYVDTYS